MKRKMIVTVAGADRVGIVGHVTKFVLDRDGNVEASRMARLGGEFIVLMLVAVPDANYDALDKALGGLTSEGFAVTTRETGQLDPEERAGWLPYRVEVSGADHEGIVHTIAQTLADRGINIETMETGMHEAPMTGTPLFTMEAVVLVPPGMNYRKLAADLEKTADELNVDAEIAPFQG